MAPSTTASTESGSPRVAPEPSAGLELSNLHRRRPRQEAPRAPVATLCRKVGSLFLLCSVLPGLYFAATSGVCLTRSGAAMVFQKKLHVRKKKQRSSPQPLLQRPPTTRPSQLLRAALRRRVASPTTR